MGTLMWIWLPGHIGMGFLGFYPSFGHVLVFRVLWSVGSGFWVVNIFRFGHWAVSSVKTMGADERFLLEHLLCSFCGDETP